METFNVVIADDHPIVLLGVRELVERDQRFQRRGRSRWLRWS
jgi:two-component system capsular synthesis response regulator RcsB